MSDSEISSPAAIPSIAEIEQTLRRVVREALTRDEEITVNLARTRAESQLGLETGYLKDTGDWKQRSKAIIGATVDDPTSPTKSSKAAPKTKPKPAKPKRQSEPAQSNRKRQKRAAKVELEEEDGQVPVSESDDDLSVRGRSAAEEQDKNLSAQGNQDSDPSDPLPDEDESQFKPTESKQKEDDESDLSSVIDDPPPKKRQRKSTSSEIKSKSKDAAKPASTKTKAAGKESSADEEEMKRLQGWLIKCGIRKLWHRELAPCKTSKDKLRHLKGLLTDVGMTGRYSVEKARQIKERRELAAELQSAQEYNEKWGRSGSEDAEEGKEALRPRKAAPKGLVDFGDSGDSSG